jgi:hypothetical protein
LVAIVPPRWRNRRRNAAWSPATSMSAQPGSSRALVQRGRHQTFELRSTQPLRRDPVRNLGPIVVRQVDRAARMQEPRFGKIFGRSIKERPRRATQQRNLRATVAFQPERRRTAGRVVSALRFAFDDQCSSALRDFGAKAGAGDPAADDHNVESTHFKAGYELESRAV